MRRTFLIGFWSMVALVSSASLAQETGAVYQNRTAPTLSDVRTNSGTARYSAGNPANRWRYRYYNGRWWYYHPTNGWLSWNGNRWTGYARQSYRPSFDSQLQPRYRYNYGRRPLGTIQAEKNAAKAEEFEFLDRPLGTIQAEKNDSKAEGFGSPDRRPLGTIQREKNNVRDD